MKKIDESLDLETKEIPVIDVLDELVFMDRRNPFREEDNNNYEIGEDNVRAATVLVFMLKAALVAMLTAAKSSQRNK